MTYKLARSLLIFLVIASLSGCSFNIPYAEERNYKSEYESAKKAIKNKYELFQKNEHLLNSLMKKKSIDPFEIAKKYKLISPDYLNEKPDKKGMYRAKYEMAENINSKGNLLKPKNLGKLYLLEGVIKNIVKQKANYYFKMKGRRGLTYIIFSWIWRNKKTLDDLKNLKKGDKVTIFGYFGGLYKINKTADEKEKKPLFFHHLMIHEE